MKNKILIFIDWYKPGFKAGGPIRSISNLVSQLNHQYEFYIVTRNTDYLSTTPYPNLKFNQWVVVDGAKVMYLTEGRRRKSNFKEIIKTVNPNTIYCNSLYSPKFTLLPIQLGKKLNITCILAVRGMLSQGSLSVKSKKKQLFLGMIKAYGLFKNVKFHATSLQEKKDIAAVFGKETSISIAANLAEKSNTEFIEKEKVENELKLVYVGRIAPEKNTLYAINALKKCSANITFDFYGPVYASDYLNECHEAINQLPKNIVVSYKDILNHEDLGKTLSKYHVIYAPSTGENFGHSIIEGMAHSCIPVISNRTPWLNLASSNIGFDIDLENIEVFAQKLDKIAQFDQQTFSMLSKNAYNYAINIINNKEPLEEYHKLFQFSN